MAPFFVYAASSNDVIRTVGSFDLQAISRRGTYGMKRPKAYNTACKLEEYGLMTYIFNDYYLRYFLSQVARHAVFSAN